MQQRNQDSRVGGLGGWREATVRRPRTERVARFQSRTRTFANLTVACCFCEALILFFTRTYYLFNSPVFSSPHPPHPPHPASQPGYEHIAGPEGSRVDNLRSVHMAEQGASEEDWHAETKQVYDSEA